MIIAHNQFDLLERLICALDCDENDIYVHIDAKVKNFDFDYFEGLVKYSHIYFTPRVRVTWGDFSQVKAQMLLIEAAVKNQPERGGYSYFHLISGCDLPIKSNAEINKFFSENRGKEFIHFSSDRVTESSVNRIRYYHFFRSRRNTFFKLISFALYKIQTLLGVDRLRKSGIKVQKGCNWFSITGDFAQYIYENMERWERIFRYSYCADEVFVQTILVNSPFKDNLYMPECGNNHLACARLIDWNRGNPYVFRKEDFEQIKSSPAVFARKFDTGVDCDIIDMVLESNKK